MATSPDDLAERDPAPAARAFRAVTGSEPASDSFRRWFNRRWPSRSKPAARADQ